MPTWNWPLDRMFLGWTLLAFGITFILNSFTEWLIHQFVMHKRQKLLPYPYELHHIGHHGMFRADETYHAQSDEMKSHITFVPRDYVLILGVTLPFWIIAELVI